MSERILAGYYRTRAPWLVAPQGCPALQAFLRESPNPMPRLAIPQPTHRMKATALEQMIGLARLTCRAVQQTHSEVEQGVSLEAAAIEKAMCKSGVSRLIRGLSYRYDKGCDRELESST